MSRHRSVRLLRNRPRRVRRTLSGLVAVAVTASLTVAVVGTHSPGVGASTLAPTIDLNNPTAMIADPAAGLVPVNTTCTTGKVDLNTASAAAIGAALGVPSDPTVNRLIALRPWLKGADLSSVPGIGPSKAAVFAGKTCATQPAPTSAQLRACSSTSQVDLNSATSKTMQAALRLPAVTTDAIVAARPLPQNLSQVIAPRIPGFPQPTVDALTAQNRICVTPAPYTSGNTVYRWATARGGAVVRNGAYALIVPPGRVTSPTGSYISVVPLGPDADGLPSMDATIYGPWNIGVTPVAIQGPWSGTSDVRPAVFHASADQGTTLSVGDGTATSTVNGTPVVTALAYSLSGFSFGTSPCNSQDQPSNWSTTTPSLCLQALTDGSLHNQWLQQLSSYGAASAAGLTPKPVACDTTQTGVSEASMAGDPQNGLSCGLFLASSPEAPGTAHWSITNEASLSSKTFGVLDGGVVFTYDTSDAYGTHIEVTGAEDNPVVSKILGWLSAKVINHNLLFPGAAVRTTKTPSFLPSGLTAQVDIPFTIIWSAIEALVGSLAEMAGRELDIIYQTLDTAYNCITSLDRNEVLGCVKSLIEGAAEVARVTVTNSLAKSIFGSIKKVFAAITVGEIGASVAAAFILHANGPTDLSYYNTPNKPTGRTDAEGRLVIDDCWDHTDVAWFVNETCQNSFYDNSSTPGGTNINGGKDGTITSDAAPEGHVLFRLGGDGPASVPYVIYNNNKTAYDVVLPPPAAPGTIDQATWNCLSRKVPMRDYLPVSKIFGYGTQESGTPAVQAQGCPSAWPDRTLAANATNWILRKTNGEAFLLDGNSVARPIPDGGTYICLAQKFYVLNATTSEELAQFPTGADATCP